MWTVCILRLVYVWMNKCVCDVSFGDLMLISQGLSYRFLWDILIHHLCLFVVCVACSCCCLCHAASWRDQILNFHHLINSNSWSIMGLHFLFIACSLLPLWPLPMHAGKPFTSFLCNTLFMSRLSQMALGHPLHSPPVSFFPIEPWSLSFLSCHTPWPLPPDRMALELRAWKRPSYTTLRTVLTQNL